jgi:hypothetical protein
MVATLLFILSAAESACGRHVPEANQFAVGANTEAISGAVRAASNQASTCARSAAAILSPMAIGIVPKRWERRRCRARASPSSLPICRPSAHRLGFPLINIRFQHFGSFQHVIEFRQWQPGHLATETVLHPLHHRAVYRLLEWRLGDGLAKIADCPFRIFRVVSVLHPEYRRHYSLQAFEVLGTEAPLIQQPEFQFWLKFSQHRRVRLDQVEDLGAVLPARVAVVDHDRQDWRQAVCRIDGLAAHQMVVERRHVLASSAPACPCRSRPEIRAAGRGRCVGLLVRSTRPRRPRAFSSPG